MTSIKPSSLFGNVTEDMMTSALSFLNSDELTTCEGVSKGWRALINKDDQYLWRLLCDTLSIQAQPSRDGEAIDYKLWASVPHGELTLHSKEFFIYNRLPGDFDSEIRWGTEGTEPCITIKVQSEESTRECVALYGNMFQIFLQ